MAAPENMRACLIACLIAAAAANTHSCSGASEHLNAAQCRTWQQAYDTLHGERWPACANARNDPCGCIAVRCDGDRIASVRGKALSVAKTLLAAAVAHAGGA